MTREVEKRKGATWGKRVSRCPARHRPSSPQSPSFFLIDLERVLVCEEGDACRLVVGAELELQDSDSGRSGQRDARTRRSAERPALLSLSLPSLSFNPPSVLSRPLTSPLMHIGRECRRPSLSYEQTATDEQRKRAARRERQLRDSCFCPTLPSPILSSSSLFLTCVVSMQNLTSWRAAEAADEGTATRGAAVRRVGAAVTGSGCSANAPMHIPQAASSPLTLMSELSFLMSFDWAGCMEVMAKGRRRVGGKEN